MNWLVAASNGSRMLTPNALSGPAPSRPASMIPGPAPVMIIQSWAAMAVASRRAWSYSGSSGSVRADPKMASFRSLL